MVAELKKVAITSVFILDLKASLSAAQLLTLDSLSVVVAAARATIVRILDCVDNDDTRTAASTVHRAMYCCCSVGVKWLD